MVNQYHKAVKTVIKASKSVTLPGLAATAASLAIEGAYTRKAKKIKEGGPVGKKEKAQIKKNKAIVAKRKAKKKNKPVQDKVNKLKNIKMYRETAADKRKRAT